MMKKQLAAILMIALLMLSVSACGTAAVSSGSASASAESAASASAAAPIEIDGNAYAAYDANGYTHGSVTTCENEEGNLVMSIFFNSPDKTDCVRVDAILTEEQHNELEALDFFDDNFYDEQWAIITALPEDEITVVSLNDQIPSADELNAYVGKTVSDMTADGYEWCNEVEDEDGNTQVIYCNFNTYVLVVLSIDGDYFSMSDDEIAAATVTGLQFYGFDG